jgi:hypothetical protein
MGGVGVRESREVLPSASDLAAESGEYSIMRTYLSHLTASRVLGAQ